MAKSIELPDLVEKRLAGLGRAGREWRQRLPAIVEELSRRFKIEFGRVLHGGTESLVLEALRGEEAFVLKVGVPGAVLEREAAAYRLVDGRGYARLIGEAIEHNAILLERLGEPLALQGLSVDAQVDWVCRALSAAWIPVRGDPVFQPAKEKAEWLRNYIRAHRELGNLNDEAIDRAFGFLDDRERADDPTSAVLIHGDGHAHNLLASKDGGYRYVDPDGMAGEPALDLAIPMREWPEDLLATGDPIATGLRRAERIAGATGVAIEAIWRWGYIECVSTSLHLKELDIEPMAEEYMAVARAWGPCSDFDP